MSTGRSAVPPIRTRYCPCLVPTRLTHTLDLSRAAAGAFTSSKREARRSSVWISLPVNSGGEWPFTAHLARSRAGWRTSPQGTHNSRSPLVTGSARHNRRLFDLLPDKPQGGGTTPNNTKNTKTRIRANLTHDLCNDFNGLESSSCARRCEFDRFRDPRPTLYRTLKRQIYLSCARFPLRPIVLCSM